MSAAGELPASPQAARDARFDCLEDRKSVV